MRAAFVVAVADPGASLPAHVLQLLSSPERPPHLGFDPAAHVFWTSADGRTALGAWQELPAADRTCWNERAGGVAVVCGTPRRVGSPWRPRAEWPDVVRELLGGEGSPPTDPSATAGLWVGAALETDGRGLVVNDPLALRTIHHARGRNRTVAASNPHLAAWAACAAGASPARNVEAVCSLAATGQRFVRHSGYTGVEPLRPGSSVVLEPGTGPRLVERPAIWWPPDSYLDAGRDELVDLAADGIVEAVATAPTFPAQLVVAGLTGGRDSRLVLAGALLAGVTDAVLFKTDGPEQLADAVVARELAARYGLHHADGRGLQRVRHERVIEKKGRRRRVSWRSAVLEYVESTAGADNIMQVRDSTGGWSERDELLLNGLMGESLRSHVEWQLPTEAHAVDWLDRRMSYLCLLYPDARRACRDRVVDDLLADPTGGRATRHDLLDWYQTETRHRLNFGVREETRGYLWIHPAYSLQTFHAAMAMGGHARMCHEVHRLVCAKADPALAEHRLVGKAWPQPDPEPPRILGDRDRPRPGHNKRSADPAKAKSLGHVRAAAQIDDRVALLREVLADRANPAWEYIDRTQVERWMPHYGELRSGAQCELMGAAVAALWLAP